MTAVPATLAQPGFRFLGRSFLAFVLAPNPPLADWLGELDTWLKRSKGALANRPVVLDLSRFGTSKDEVDDVLRTLRARDLRVVSVEGVAADWVAPELAPLPAASGRPVTAALPAPAETQAAADSPPRPASLLLDRNIRSGETISFLDGDVTVCGSVSSGAEILAGGSVHVYGALRGRVVAGAPDNQEARIFCRRFDAELLGIAGYYQVAEDAGADLAGQPVEARLSDGQMLVRRLD